MANEKRLIDANKVYKNLHEAGGCDAERNSWADGWDKAIDEVIRIVEETPTVDAVEVVHGRWIDVHKMLSACKCTACGTVRETETPYCPNCGAKMDGDRDN